MNLIFPFAGVGLGLVGAVWVVVEGVILIFDRNRKYTTPFQYLLKLHNDALTRQKQEEQLKVENTTEREKTQQETRAESRPWEKI